MKRNVIIGIVVLVVAAAGAFVYFRQRARSTAQAQQDPALQIALALTALERSGTYALTTDQIKSVLPLLRVLRDTDPNDAEASRALAESIRKILTPEQTAALTQMRQEAQSRRQQGGGQGFQGPRRGPGGPGVGPGGPGGPGFGPGGPAGQNAQGRAAFRAQARQILLGRLIRHLESRL